jgi:hypothetical protein
MNLKKLLKILLVLNLSSCASIKVPDVEVCANITSSKGYCVKTLSLTDREVSGQEWVDFNRRSLKMSPESYAEIKAVLLKLCKKSNECNYQETTEKIAYLESMMNSKLVNE